MKKKKKKKSCPWLLIDRVKWLCACVMCWPHRVGVSVCHLAFTGVKPCPAGLDLDG